MILSSMKGKKGRLIPDLPNNSILPHHTVTEFLGSGWEGEVYLIKEQLTGIERALKMFYPNTRHSVKKRATAYARKLHTLRHCSMLMQYHTQQIIHIQGEAIHAFVSEYIEGTLLSDFIKQQRGKKMHPFHALHLLYDLVLGLEEIHAAGQFHGDLHAENIIVVRQGLQFELKLLDLYQWQDTSTAEQKKDDIVHAISIFYEAIGGSQVYSQMPPAIKYMCAGMKRPSILERFRSMAQLRSYLEQFDWSE